VCNDLPTQNTKFRVGKLKSRGGQSEKKAALSRRYLSYPPSSDNMPVPLFRTSTNDYMPTFILLVKWHQDGGGFSWQNHLQNNKYPQAIPTTNTHMDLLACLAILCAVFLPPCYELQCYGQFMSGLPPKCGWRNHRVTRAGRCPKTKCAQATHQMCDNIKKDIILTFYVRHSAPKIMYLVWSLSPSAPLVKCL